MGTTAGKYYFTADVHMGSKDDSEGLLEREFVDFLHAIPQDAKALYLLGDIFDFWVDYKEVVPRGYVRTLAALAELVDRGVEVFFYPGNHDWWVTDYFEKELGVRIVRDSCQVLELGGRRICTGHGDMPGASDWKSKFIFHLFRNRFCIALMKALPTRLSFGIAHGWSASSRKGHPEQVNLVSTGLYEFADSFGRKRAEAGEPAIDLYIFGHIHTPARVPVPSGGELVILGDWSSGPQYFCI